MERLINNPLLLPVGLIAIFYITFFVPERRRKADEAKRLAAITKNDRVVTVGGIHGVVVESAPGSETVTLRIDEKAGTRIKVNRSALVAVTSAKADSKAETGPKTELVAK